ncbi:helix-turn-helix transcriptional regulator [Helcobacillus massiliensis]|uniref:Transcriptional regulator with XRE-family HTH domain n=1 Tax=Helcobacillus massiliensis TaxID=521392 RepID=A0A839R279_9MICO|nr:helix-turn-helix transcriptional regulator [Helcobacillus massiliensis]MBB3022846.1 transcriptional regulator with XRE-family HTH domain [Helcobacillus massiliensis]
MNEMPSDIFSRRLREERTRQKISQAQVAQYVGFKMGAMLDATAITRIEQGTRALRFDEAFYIAEALKQPLLSMASKDFQRAKDEEVSDLMDQLAEAQKTWADAKSEIARLNRLIQAVSARSTAADDR